MNTRRWVGVLGVLLFFGVFALPIRGEDSDGLVRVRAVRLNFIQGEAVLQQEDGKEVDARSHMPLEESFTLFTLPGGFAEIEFENRSIVRLGEESELYFSQLALNSETGAEVTELLLRRGYATFQVRFEKGGVFKVVTADARVIPDRSAEFRVDLDSPMTFVKVFDGRVKVLGDAGDLWVKEGQMATIEPQGEQLITLVNGFEEDEWDVWNEERDRVLVVAVWKTRPTSYSRRTFDDHLDDRCHDYWYHSSFYPYRTSIFFGYPSHHWGYGHHSGYHASYVGPSYVYFNNFNHHRHGGFFGGHRRRFGDHGFGFHHDRRGHFSRGDHHPRRTFSPHPDDDHEWDGNRSPRDFRNSRWGDRDRQGSGRRIAWGDGPGRNRRWGGNRKGARGVDPKSEILLSGLGTPRITPYIDHRDRGESTRAKRQGRRGIALTRSAVRRKADVGRRNTGSRAGGASRSGVGISSDARTVSGRVVSRRAASRASSRAGESSDPSSSRASSANSRRSSKTRSMLIRRGSPNRDGSTVINRRTANAPSTSRRSRLTFRSGSSSPRSGVIASSSKARTRNSRTSVRSGSRAASSRSTRSRGASASSQRSVNRTSSRRSTPPRSTSTSTRSSARALSRASSSSRSSPSRSQARSSRSSSRSRGYRSSSSSSGRRSSSGVGRSGSRSGSYGSRRSSRSSGRSGRSSSRSASRSSGGGSSRSSASSRSRGSSSSRSSSSRSSSRSGSSSRSSFGRGRK